ALRPALTFRWHGSGPCGPRTGHLAHTTSWRGLAQEGGATRVVSLRNGPTPACRDSGAGNADGPGALHVGRRAYLEDLGAQLRVLHPVGRLRNLALRALALQREQFAVGEEQGSGPAQQLVQRGHGAADHHVEHVVGILGADPVDPDAVLEAELLD